VRPSVIAKPDPGDGKGAAQWLRLSQGWMADASSFSDVQLVEER